MFKKSRKDQYVDQAHGVVQELSGVVAPKVAQARGAIAPKVAELREQLDKDVIPQLEAARDRFAVESAQAIRNAREHGAVMAAEAGSRASAALHVEDVPEEPSSKGSKLVKLLFVVAMGGIGAAVAKKLAGGDSSDNWQSSYTPSPAPSTTPPAATGPVVDPDAPVPGASPGETVADSAEEPHPVTTPEDPAEVIEVDPKGPRTP